MTKKLADFSKNRLGGEPVPDDVKILLKHYRELAARVSIYFHLEKVWVPWLDRSYLNTDDIDSKDIIANVRAIEGVCKYISFFASDDELQFYGYWRGRVNRPVSESPIVFLDNEGIFRLYGPTFAQAILTRTSISVDANQIKSWMEGLGIKFATRFDFLNLIDPPEKLHVELYNKMVQPS